MRDGLHLRVRNINLSYAIPSSVNSLIGFKEVRLFVTGHNLFVMKTYEEDFDPQMQSGTGWYYPQTKSFTFGVNLTL
jgi:hypothetical protein